MSRRRPSFAPIIAFAGFAAGAIIADPGESADRVEHRVDLLRSLGADLRSVLISLVVLGLLMFGISRATRRRPGREDPEESSP